MRALGQIVACVLALSCLRNALHLVAPELGRPATVSIFRADVEDARTLLRGALPAGQDYWMEPDLRQDVDFYQHLIFAVWPLRPGQGARYRLQRPRTQESAPTSAAPHCELLKTQGEVALVRCD